MLNDTNENLLKVDEEIGELRISKANSLFEERDARVAQLIKNINEVVECPISIASQEESILLGDSDGNLYGGIEFLVTAIERLIQEIKEFKKKNDVN